MDIKPKGEALQDLDFLLKILLATHKKTKKFSGFTRPFDFTSFKTSIPLEYADNIGGTICLNSKKLTSWMREYKTKCENEEKDYLNKDIFFNYLKERYPINSRKLPRLQTTIDTNWSEIKERFNIIQMIEDKLTDAKIAFIELDDANSTDAQKSFYIVNQGGQQLTSAEILSAKPRWNKKIKNPSPELKDNVKILYKKMRIEPPEGVVRWDALATFMHRINLLNFIFKKLKYDEKTQFEVKITLGFQLVSAVFIKGVSQHHIEKLSMLDESSINWDSDIENLIKDFNMIGSNLIDDSFFSFFNSWNNPLIQMTSNAVAVTFIILTYLDWKRKNKPARGTQYKQFVKNSRVLFDRLIYEWITNRWASSIDTKIKERIKSFSTEPDVYLPIPPTTWEKLIVEIIDDYKINGTPISQNKVDKKIKAILYYYYTQYFVK